MQYLDTMFLNIAQGCRKLARLTEHELETHDLCTLRGIQLIKVIPDLFLVIEIMTDGAVKPVSHEILAVTSRGTFPPAFPEMKDLTEAVNVRMTDQCGYSQACTGSLSTRYDETIH